jgi:hypothetical protein
MQIKLADAIALLAVPLVVVAFIAGGAVWPTICLCLAGAIVVYVVAEHHELPWQRRIAISSVVFAVDLAMVLYLYRVNRVQALREQVAPLVAAALPNPNSSNCPVPRGAVALYLGNMVSAVTEFPHVVFRSGGEDLLVLDRNSDGLVVTFTAFDGQGKPLARLERNNFTAINPACHVERPSANNLVVSEDSATKLLDVQFLNPQAIKLTGVLRYPGQEPIFITEKYAGKGGEILPPECTSGNKPDFATR